MNMARVFAVLTLGLLGSFGPAEACSCLPWNLCTEMYYRNAIFGGHVVQIRPAAHPDSTRWFATRTSRGRRPPTAGPRCRTAAFKQIGNAVPPLLALAVAQTLKKTLLRAAHVVSDEQNRQVA